MFVFSATQSYIRLEVNQAMGLKYYPLAVASVKCWELLASAGGKVHGQAVLTGVESMQQCVSVGGLEYWMKLKLPITQTAKLYQVWNIIISYHYNNNYILLSNPCEIYNGISGHS